MLNGGIKTIAEIKQHLSLVDGVMLGREIYNNPYRLTEICHLLDQPKENEFNIRLRIMCQYLKYVEGMLMQGEKLNRLLHPVFGLFHNQVYGRHWRRLISECETLLFTEVKQKVHKFLLMSDKTYVGNT